MARGKTSKNGTAPNLGFEAKPRTEMNDSEQRALPHSQALR